MKKSLLALSIAAVGLSACVQTKTDLGFAMFHNAIEPKMVNDNAQVTKVGKACGENIVAIIASGDFSLEAAKRNGGIARVATVDSQVENILGLYGKRCTIVRGS